VRGRSDLACGRRSPDTFGRTRSTPLHSLRTLPLARLRAIGRRPDRRDRVRSR